MKLITYDDIRNLNIDYSTCYQWAEEMIAKKRQAILPPKISISSRPGIHDVNFAGHIYELVSDAQDIKMNVPEDKFWI